MQTPPDSDPESGGQRVIEQHAPEETPAIAVGVGGTWQRRYPDTSKSTRVRLGASGREKLLNRRQKTSYGRSADQDGLEQKQPTTQSLLLHKPSSATTRLRSDLIAMLVRTKRADTWFDLVPSRIGQSEAVDSAAKAIVKAAEHAALNTAVSQDSCLGSYGKAITTLRGGMGKSVSCDEMLLTVSLLVNFERMFAYISVPLKSHMHGVVAVLMNQARTSTKAPSEITRAIHYTFWPVTFIGPCVMGAPSPFENSYWLDMEPAILTKDKMKTPWEAVSKLRKLSNQHFIRLPRLVMLAKSLQTTLSPEQPDTAFELAKDLLVQEDLEAENELLHHVQVQKTKVGPCADIAPYSMNFATIPEFEAAMHYWSTRVLLDRLCRRLSGLYPTKYQEHKLPGKSELEADISRMAANILMACHWGLDKGETGESMIILNLVAIWGVLNDFDVFAGRGLTPAKVRAFLRQCGQSIMRPTGPDPAEEVGRRLDAASEIFVGGQTTGVLAFTFRKPGPNG